MKRKDLIKLFEDNFLKHTCFGTLGEVLKDNTPVDSNAYRALLACQLVGTWQGLVFLNEYGTSYET
jgi:hypothetical protein